MYQHIFFFPLQDCPTRWGSSAKMVSRILEQEEAIRVVLSTDRKTSHLVPTWQDIDVLQSIHQALSPLCNLTDILSGEDYVTVSAVIPLMDLINNNFLKETEEEDMVEGPGFQLPNSCTIRSKIPMCMCNKFSIRASFQCIWKYCFSSESHTKP